MRVRINIISVCLLSLYLVFAGCSKEDGREEISDEFLQEALSNLTNLDENINPLFLNSEDANELGKHLDKIKAMPGVADAWVEDASTLWIKIENGGYKAYYYPIEPAELDAEIENVSVMADSLTVTHTTATKASGAEFCIINQISNDQKFVKLSPYLSNQASRLKEKGLNVRIVDNKEFTIDFFMNEMPQYQFIFLVTHGHYSYDKYENGFRHWILTGSPSDTENQRWMYRVEWGMYKVCFISIKEIAEGNVPVYRRYVSVSDDIIREQMDSFKDGSILFNTACSSLKDNNEIWDALHSANLSCYLGFTGMNKIGHNSGFAFFQNMLSGMTTKEAYDLIPMMYKQELTDDGMTYLKIFPADSKVTLIGTPVPTGVEAVDLGLSIKWASKNLGAGNVKELGNKYPDLDFNDLYEIYPELWEQDIEQFDISKTKMDYAYEALGGDWRMPTIDEWKELKEKCQWKATRVDDTYGFLVTGPNKNTIFLPAKLRQEPVMGIYHFESTYGSSTLTPIGLKALYLIGSVAPYGITSCQSEEMWVAENAYIRPVCK